MLAASTVLFSASFIKCNKIHFSRNLVLGKCLSRKIGMLIVILKDKYAVLPILQIIPILQR